MVSPLFNLGVACMALEPCSLLLQYSCLPLVEGCLVPCTQHHQKRQACLIELHHLCHLQNDCLVEEAFGFLPNTCPL